MRYHLVEVYEMMVFSEYFLILKHCVLYGITNLCLQFDDGVKGMVSKTGQVTQE